MSEAFSFVKVNSSLELEIDEKGRSSSSSGEILSSEMDTTQPETEPQSPVRAEFYDPNDPKYSSYSVPGFSPENGSTRVDMNEDAASLSSEIRYRGKVSSKYTGFGSGFLERNGFSWLTEQTADDDDEEYNTSILFVFVI